MRYILTAAAIVLLSASVVAQRQTIVYGSGKQIAVERIGSLTYVWDPATEFGPPRLTCSDSPGLCTEAEIAALRAKFTARQQKAEAKYLRKYGPRKELPNDASATTPIVVTGLTPVWKTVPPSTTNGVTYASPAK